MMAGTERRVATSLRWVCAAAVAAMLLSLWLPSVQVAGQSLNGWEALYKSVTAGATLVVDYIDPRELWRGVAMLFAAALNLTAPAYAFAPPIVRRVLLPVVAAGILTTVLLAMRVHVTPGTGLMAGFYVWLAGVAALTGVPIYRQRLLGRR